MRSLEELVKDLPPDLRQEVRDFVERLLRRSRGPTRRGMGFSWAGALQDCRDQYTAVDLQHESLKWWGDSCS
jgi:hypothetical protein